MDALKRIAKNIHYRFSMAFTCFLYGFGFLIMPNTTEKALAKTVWDAKEIWNRKLDKLGWEVQQEWLRRNSNA